MKQELNQMLSKYKIETIDDKKNAIKEIVQESVLCGLARAGFFRDVAFYGGTALRIFYGLDRFSEDLDFSLITPNPNFDLNKFFPMLENEIKALGLNFSIEEKVKTKDSNIKSAFLKGNTKEHIITFYENLGDAQVNKEELLRIKFEVDTNPPPFANYENKIGLLPYPYQVKLYDKSSLFAGKVHAVLARAWISRTKGRDLYDYVFYLSMGAKVNLAHLKARLIQTGQITEDFDLTENSLKEMLAEKFKTIDYDNAKEDVKPFIKDNSKLDLWSAEFFIAITQNLKAN